MSEAYFLGIDMGTQGARVALLNEQGTQVAAFDEAFNFTEKSREEQSPLEWWSACKRLIKKISETVSDLDNLKSVTVTSTSGTIIPINESGVPLHNAIMYSDPRSEAEALICKAAADQFVKRGYKAFNSSSGLPKMLWYLNTYGEKDLYKFIHAADFISGSLSGRFDVTDYTNALKSGYDLHENQWPKYILDLGIKKEWLQTVVSSGEPVGVVKCDLAKEWNLPESVIITSGMTDGCVSQVASGAVAPGQWNTTIGTTLVVKGVTRFEIEDPQGSIYNHKHPEGYWMPGGASSTGGDWVSAFFKKDELESLNLAAARLIPTGIPAWPLLQKGERFPFFSPQAEGFWPQDEGQELMFSACMEGVAYIERYAYERIKELSGEEVKEVYSAGGGSNSDTWMSIRSSVLNVPINKMMNTSGAAGAAVLGASKTYYPGIAKAAEMMIKIDKKILPNPDWVEKYEEGYKNFIEELKKRKYL